MGRCRICKEDYPKGKRLPHMWDKHRPEMLAQASAGGKKAAELKKQEMTKSEGKKVKKGEGEIKGSTTPSQPSGGKAIASVVAPGAGAILFKFGSEEIPMNPFEMTRCYEYYRSLKRNLNLKDPFTAVMEDAMDMLYSILVEGGCVLPQVGPMPILVVEEESVEEGDNGRGEGFVSEALAEAAAGGTNTD